MPNKLEETAPLKTNMTMENPAFEDMQFPIKTGDFSMSTASFQVIFSVF